MAWSPLRRVNAGIIRVRKPGDYANLFPPHPGRHQLADETGLTIKVRHYPPGTSKWNRIEHRLFCRITQNWRGRPLTDHATIIELIAATSTKTGLKVESALDTRTYEKGIKVTKAEMKRLDIRGDAFHPEWNYSVVPRASFKIS